MSKNKGKKWRRGDTWNTGGVVPTEPTRTQAETLEIERSACAYHIGLPPAFTRPITYAMYGNGICEIRRTSVGVSYRPTVGKVLGLENMPEGFVLTLPRVPWDEFAKVVAFFIEVKNQRKTEAYAQVWRRGNGYHVVVPRQEVGNSHVKHEGDYDPTGNETHVMDLHSHPGSAFFSGGDDEDEVSDGRIYAVIGDLDKRIPSIKLRVRSGAEFLPLELRDVIELPTTDLTLKVKWRDVLEGKVGEIPSPFTDVRVPQVWHTALYESRSNPVWGQSSLLIPGDMDRFNPHQGGWDKQPGGWDVPGVVVRDQRTWSRDVLPGIGSGSIGKAILESDLHTLGIIDKDYTIFTSSLGLRYVVPEPRGNGLLSEIRLIAKGAGDAKPRSKPRI
jgi:hypothetical protein